MSRLRKIGLGSLAAVLAADVVLYSAIITRNSEKAEAAALPHPDSVCDITNTKVSNIDLKKAAEDCLNDRRGGQVALVGYGLAIDDLQRAAVEGENIIDAGTGGLARPEIVPMLAPPDTLKRFRDTNQKCSSIELQNSASVIADKTMDLAKYGHVIAVTDTPPCDNAEAGITHFAEKSRYIDIYDQHNMPEYRDIDEDSDVHTMADDIAHEFGHAIGMGHASRIVLDSGGYGYFDLRNDSSRDSATELDLTPPSAVLDHEYMEYDGYINLMGKHQGGAKPLEAQRWQLQWPERALGRVTDSQQIINGNSLLIQTPLDPNHDFAALHLDQPAVFKQRSLKDKLIVRNGFTKLIFEPSNYEGSLHVYFATDDHVHTLELGYIDVPEQPQSTITIKIGDQTIRLQNIDEKGVQITDLTPKSK